MGNNRQLELMRAPPLLMGAALLIWGWQTDYLLYAAIMAVLLELPHWMNWRTNLSDKDFSQLSDLSGLVFAATVIYIFIDYSVHGIFKILELVPFVFFLLILAQQYSRRGRIKLSALFPSMRKLDKTALADYPDALDISLPYLFICLLAASAGNKEQQLFFPILCLFFLSILWHIRPGNYHPVRWCLPVLLVFVLSFFTQSGLKALQGIMERNIMVWFDQFAWQDRDINRATTAIGSLGRLKLSDRVALRIERKESVQIPLLLHEATYNSYQYGVWSNLHADFAVVDKDPVQSNWVINRNGHSDSKITIANYSDNDHAILPAPYGTLTIAGGGILELSKSPHSSIKIENKPGWMNYHINYSGGNPLDIEPAEEDLIVPNNYFDDFRRLAENLDLDNLSGWEIIQAVDAFFAENFRYSIVQNQRYPKGRYLTNFLFRDRKGHCEYFATATALLLRTAGVPARYAVGFSAHEYSHWQKMYLVRARDVHSWTTFYLDDKWHTIDTTPSVWATMEAEDRSILEGLFDLASWFGYKLSDGNPAEDSKTNYVPILLLIPLILFISRRLIPRNKSNEKISPDANDIGKDRHGADSPFYKLIAKLEEASNKRNPGETLSLWLVRILPGTVCNDYLNAAQLHYLYRFGHIPGEHIKRELDRKVEQLLENLSKATE